MRDNPPLVWLSHIFLQSPHQRTGRNSAGWCPGHRKRKHRHLCNSDQCLMISFFSFFFACLRICVYMNSLCSSSIYIGGRDWNYWWPLVLSMARTADPRSARAGYVLPRFQPRSCETVDHESRVVFEFQPRIGQWPAPAQGWQQRKSRNGGVELSFNWFGAAIVDIFECIRYFTLGKFECVFRRFSLLLSFFFVSQKLLTAVRIEVQSR